jgi:hypothetical protein
MIIDTTFAAPLLEAPELELLLDDEPPLELLLELLLELEELGGALLPPPPPQLANAIASSAIVL